MGIPRQNCKRLGRERPRPGRFPGVAARNASAPRGRRRSRLLRSSDDSGASVQKTPDPSIIEGLFRCLVAYIICEPCVGTKDTACVDVCPVDCIHPRKDEAGFAEADMLYIHPDECIDCGACVPACPVEAIFALDETPQKWADFIEKNAQYYRSS
jgi:NAD-dependent dihydropyrimidine dehydrogenase PreA subunit